jgi:hypothetical protein
MNGGDKEKLSGSLDKQSDWNYRTVDSRRILVKGRSDDLRKISAIDVLTGLPFPLEAPTDFNTQSLEKEKGYFVTFKIYTLKRVEEVPADFVEFFKVLDVDQKTEDFIKAYWLYPRYIKFELVEAGPL